MNKSLSENAATHDVYVFFSTSMTYPEANWFTQEYISTCVTFLSSAGLTGGAEEIRERAAAESPDAFLEEVRIEYTRLFINTPSSCPAPPYGSVYMESGRSLYGNSTERVLEFYRQNGFEPVAPQAVPDELSIELEFLAMLAGEGKRETEQEFISTLFRPWFVKFRDAVTGNAEHPFYRTMVMAIDAFTGSEN
jgi:TorA maturation chaperone TorD